MGIKKPVWKDFCSLVLFIKILVLYVGIILSTIGQVVGNELIANS
jgi:hypothetical protein